MGCLLSCGSSGLAGAPCSVLSRLFAISRLGRVLDTGPHFRYGVAVDPVRPNLHPEPHLIAATQESIPGDLWLTFKIYQRSAQSLGERPIPIELKFEFEEDSDEHQAFKDWVKYGKPAEAPATFSADLPGGLDRGTHGGKGISSAAERVDDPVPPPVPGGEP